MKASEGTGSPRRDARPQIDFVVAGIQKAGTRASPHLVSQDSEIGLVSEPT